MARITLDDSLLSAIVKMAEGDPGGAGVLSRLYTLGGAIDPDSAFGGFGAIMALDQHGIYGSRIWKLFKDVCSQDLVRVVGVLRAVQLGYLKEETLSFMIDGSMKCDAEVDEMVAKVKDRLPAFGGNFAPSV